jgi:hypothetical protein
MMIRVIPADQPGVEGAVQCQLPCQWLREETDMRALFLCGLTFVALPLIVVASHPTRTWAQSFEPRPVAPLAVEQLIPTRIGSLLAATNLVLVADYYRIDMRFGPSLRIDALVVESVDARTRVKGLRVRVQDTENRRRQEGTSFIDSDELPGLLRALTSMTELAGKWNYDDRQATELAFTTTGGFRIAIRQSARIPRGYLSTGLLDPVVTSIDIVELPTLKQAFDQALAILNGK